MAYPYYTPYNFNPYNYSYQPQQIVPPVQQPQMLQNAQQTTTTPQTITSPSSLIWISNERDAALYPVAPNNAVALWNQNEPVVYLKQADASGKPSMKIYDLVERTEKEADVPKNDSVKDSPYAMKEDVATLAGIVKGFDSMIASIKGDIEKMSGDLYGIAGKKKTTTAKKTEDNEE